MALALGAASALAASWSMSAIAASISASTSGESWGEALEPAGPARSVLFSVSGMSDASLSQACPAGRVWFRRPVHATGRMCGVYTQFSGSGSVCEENLGLGLSALRSGGSQRPAPAGVPIVSRTDSTIRSAVRTLAKPRLGVDGGLLPGTHGVEESSDLHQDRLGVVDRERLDIDQLVPVEAGEVFAPPRSCSRTSCIWISLAVRRMTVPDLLA
jgi:hypothetical protein